MLKDLNQLSYSLLFLIEGVLRSDEKKYDVYALAYSFNIQWGQIFKRIEAEYSTAENEKPALR